MPSVLLPFPVQIIVNCLTTWPNTPTRFGKPRNPLAIAGIDPVSLSAYQPSLLLGFEV